MNEMYLRFPGGKKKAFTISYDDNVTQDERLIQLMRQHGIKGTFNVIPGWFAKEDAVFPEGETYINVTEKKALELYSDELVEVANHGFLHKKMTSIPTMQMMEDTVKCRQKLESMYEKFVTGYAYPYGWYDGKLKQILKEGGISYARTVCSTCNFGAPEDWLEWHPTCHHADERMPGLVERFLNEDVNEHPYLFYVWGHTFEFDQQDNWHIIEELFEQIAGKEDVWYATNGEICDYYNAYQSLRFTADGKGICNPTSTDLWVEIDRNLHEVPAGVTLWI